MEGKTEKNSMSRAAGGILSAVAFLFLAANADAATLHFSPSSGAYHVGDSFQVGVYVNTPDQAMNACQASINFPADKLSVISVSTKYSIFSLLVQNPTFSNGSGSTDFAGVVLNPGYTGNNGKLVTINFQALAEGKADVTFGSAQVLANDGSGSSILSSYGSASFDIIQAAEKKIATTTKPSYPIPAPPPPKQPENPAPAGTVQGAGASTTLGVTTTGAVSTSVPPAQPPNAAQIPLSQTASALPVIFFKIGPFLIDPYIFSLIFLILLYIMSATVSAYGFFKFYYLLKRTRRKKLPKSK